MPAVSISALQDPIAIVHIPIQQADIHATRLYWTLENAPEVSDEFLNVTSNSIEIAIFAAIDLVNAHWCDAQGDVRISSAWRVFEISSGDEGETGNYDSPHLRHVSAPLARAGISILYQSSYFTDFLLVKEANFQKASAIFASQGWQVDPIVQNTASRRRSQLLSPTTPSSLTPHHASSNASPSTEQRQLPPEITVLPSALACIGLSRTSERATFEKVRQLVVWPQQAMMSWKRKSMEEMAIEAASWSTSDLMSPLSSTDLDHRAASRHSEDDVEGHLESDVKRKVKVEQEGRPFMSYTRTEDGASLVSEIRVLKGMFGRNAQGEVLQMTTGGERLSEWSDDESEDWSESDSEEGGEQEIPGTSHHHNHGSIEKQDKSLGSFRCSDRRSSFPFNVHRASSGHSTPTIGLHTPPLEDVHLPFSLPSSPLYENGPRAQDSGEKIQPPKVAQDESIGSKQSRHSKHLSLPLTPRDSPLFSTLQAGDRHGHNATTSSAIPISWCGKTHLSAHAESSATSQNNKGRKRCLQLDLRGVEDEYDGVACPFEDPYHMDKSGLVTLFSDLLHSGGIKMLYSSTFHTANVLVEARDVRRARRLLRAPRDG